MRERPPEDLRRWRLLCLYLMANRSVPQYVTDEEMSKPINQLYENTELPFNH